MQYTMKLNVGDWSRDGHNDSYSVIYKVNHTVREVQEAYKQSCSSVGVKFHDSGLFCDYEAYCISEKDFYELSQCISNIEDYLFLEDGKGWLCDGRDSFQSLWWDFVKVTLPDLEWEEVVFDNINGFWNKNLNVSFGYGITGN